MAAIVPIICRECGKPHTLCLTDADVFSPAALYEYECPGAEVPVRINCPAEWTGSERCPKDSVQVKQV